MYRKILKPTLDIIFAFIGLVFLSPLFILISILIKVESKGPVFFVKKRIGKNKKTFQIIKFRTMKHDTPSEVPTHLLMDPDAYITKIGKLLRKTSLDELPQLINILKTDMSFIGPRPALWNQYDLISERDKYSANNLYPGVSGWAQVNGRDELEIPVKAKLDGEYAKNISFGFDIKCFIKTITGIFSARGFSEGSSDK
jgi:O-antigen biosynthesis protein WbqP